MDTYIYKTREKALVHGISRAGIAKTQGQSARAGFWSGFISSAFATPAEYGMIKGTAITAAVSGTISEITGGKFANGAVTGAFIHLFNNMLATITGQVAGQTAKKVSNELGINKAMSNIIKSGTTQMVYCGIIGGLGAGPAGSFFGAIFGLSFGLIKGVIYESSGLNNFIEQNTNKAKQYYRREEY